MIQPKDVEAAVRWFTGVDPNGKQTYRARHARRLLYATLRYRSGMGVSEIATRFGRASSSVVKTMQLEVVPDEEMDAVWTRAALERDLDEEREQRERANARLLARLEEEMAR
jgi:hypothetical protein